MKKKAFDKLVVILLSGAAIALTAMFSPADTMAKTQTEAQGNAEDAEASADVISEFHPFNESEKSLTITTKLSLDELSEKMPKEISVTLSDGTEENVEVSWKSVGDYDKTDFYYYEFDPVLPEGYSVQKGVEPPYISVFLRPSSGKGPQIRRLRGNSNEEQVYNYLREEMGLNSACACGVLANINAESGFNPHATGDGGTSYGICQWHNSRWTNLKNYCSSNGYDWTTLDGQLHFLKYEVGQSYSYIFNGIAESADGAYKAGYNWCYNFERPANITAVSQSRGRVARDTYWPKYYQVPPPVTHPWAICETPGGVYGTNLVNSYYPQVKWIQAALNIIQNAGLTLDGYYGNGTKNAVVVFQQNHGLTADGVVGPNTTGKLVEELNARGYYDPKEDKKPPVISNVNVTDVSATGYTVSCTATDENGIDRVEFPTWTVLNGQDDISQNGWPRGTKNGDTYTYRVNVSEHNNESGQYITHIYAWDSRGNNVCYAVPVVEVPLPEDKKPSVSSIVVSPENVTVVRGSTQQYTADVKGKNDPDLSVDWQVSENSSAGTTISGNGVLKVGSDETSSALKVTAVSRADSSKSAAVTVNVRMFTDVFNGQFFNDAATWGAVHSVISGYAEGDGSYSFKPNDICTRAQFVTFLWRTMGMQKPKSMENPFTDIPDIKSVYFSDAVLWAYENGYVAGYSDPKGVRFGADDLVTRGQVVTFLWRAAGSPKAASEKSLFTDVKDPSSHYYGEAMMWASENGVVSGYPDAEGVRFAADDSCTRGQVVTFLWRYAQKFLDA